MYGLSLKKRRKNVFAATVIDTIAILLPATALKTSRDSKNALLRCVLDQIDIKHHESFPSRNRSGVCILRVFEFAIEICKSMICLQQKER